jgi:hypothetical protein
MNEHTHYACAFYRGRLSENNGPASMKLGGIRNSVKLIGNPGPGCCKWCIFNVTCLSPPSNKRMKNCSGPSSPCSKVSSSVFHWKALSRLPHEYKYLSVSCEKELFIEDIAFQLIALLWPFNSFLSDHGARKQYIFFSLSLPSSLCFGIFIVDHSTHYELLFPFETSFLDEPITFPLLHLQKVLEPWSMKCPSKVRGTLCLPRFIFF